LPTIRSYAFQDGKTRGMILVNFETADTLTAKLMLPAAVQNKTAQTGRRSAANRAAL
jgi:hypothetical protein